jgi:hypothetical protein
MAAVQLLPVVRACRGNMDYQPTIDTLRVSQNA